MSFTRYYGVRPDKSLSLVRQSIIFYGCMAATSFLDISCEPKESSKLPDKRSGHAMPSVRLRKPSSSTLHIDDNIYLIYLPEALRGLARSDLPAAIDAAKLLSGNDRENALENLLMAASLNNPEFVARELLTSGLSNSKMQKLSLYLVSQWKDGNAALQWADENIKGNNRGIVIGSVLVRLGKECPTSAFTYVENMGPGRPQDEAFSRFISSLTSTDALAALNFTLQVSDKQRSRVGADLVCTQWANLDPASATAYLEKSDGSETCFGMTLVLIYQKLQQYGFSRTIEWARTLPGPAAALAIKSSILQWGCVDRESTAAFLETASLKDQKAVCPQFVSDWTARDPVAAGKWVAGRQGSVVQRDMIAEVMRTWVQKSPIEASKWLGELPSGCDRDAGIEVLVRNEMFNDTTNAFRWLDEIADPKLKQKQMDLFFSLIDNQQSPK